MSKTNKPSGAPIGPTEPQWPLIPTGKTPELIIYTPRQQELLILAKDAWKAATAYTEKWRAMIEFINEHKLTREDCAPVLAEAGFNRPRQSEITRIAFSEPETVTKFLTGELKWRAALETARKAKPGKNKGNKGRATGAYNSCFRALVKTMQTHNRKALKPFAFEKDGGFIVIFPTGEFDGTVKTPAGTVLSITLNKQTKPAASK